MRPRRPKSLGTRLTLVALGGVLVTALAAAAATRAWGRPLPVLLAACGAGGLFTAWAMGGATRSARRALVALADGVRGFRDADFSLRLAANRDDEIGELLALYNDVADLLRDERREVYQRELLLDSLLQSAPVATVLTADDGRVVFSNRAARELLGGGRRLEGGRFRDTLEACPPAMREGLLAGEDVLFTTPGDRGDETFRAARRAFQMNARAHTLYTVERLTPELRRREVEVWKNAVRVINHELNNSLAPIQSLVHSGRHVLDHPQHAPKLREIFQTVEERVKHLAAFLRGYSEVARVPRPDRRDVAWAPFLDDLRRLCSFRLPTEPPPAPGYFDPALVQQALINLLKNAHESGGPPDDVALEVQPGPEGDAIVRVCDRGRGMNDDELTRALLPFYTSKPAGSGLGLALSNEIVEAHGGWLRLENRPGGGLVVTCRLPGRRDTPPGG
ncbi:MAG TPA: ATP-binding protein [Polyangiaceae bacterium]|nr:ATP-binding protein [Polyangiaceae bacterium]